MAKSQLTGSQIKDGTITRDDINVTTTGKAVVAKLLDGNNGIKIDTQTGIDSGTGDVSLKVDLNYLDTKYPSLLTPKSQNLFFASPAVGAGNPSFRSLTAGDVPVLPYVNKTGDLMTGALVFNNNSATLLKKDMSTYSGGFARDIIQLTDTTGSIDSMGWFGSGASGAVTINYGYLGGTAYNTKHAIRWTPDGRVGIGLTSSSTPQAGYALHTVGNTYTTGNVDFTGNLNNTAGELYLQRQGVNIVRTGGTNGDSVILSGKGGAVYFRPNGDAVNTGEIYINNSGTIITQNHGNSSQWYSVSQAFIANPFFSRNNIISRAVSNIASLDAELPNGGFITSYYGSSWGGSDRPTGASYGGYIRFKSQSSASAPLDLDLYYNNGHGGADLHRLWFRTKNTTVGVTNWFEIATKEGIASQLGSYVTQSALNTQLAGYAILNGVQAFTNTITFNQSPLIPYGTLAFHAVNLAQLEDYVDVNNSDIFSYVSANYLGKNQIATSTTLGGIKLITDTQNNIAPNAVTTATDRSYAVQVNNNNQAVVNVPWINDHASAGYAKLTGLYQTFENINTFLNPIKVPTAYNNEEAVNLGQAYDLATDATNTRFLARTTDLASDKTFNLADYNSPMVTSITIKGNPNGDLFIDGLDTGMTIKVLNTTALNLVVRFDGGSFSTSVGQKTWIEVHRESDGDLIKNDTQNTIII